MVWANRGAGGGQAEPRPLWAQRGAESASRTPSPGAGAAARGGERRAAKAHGGGQVRRQRTLVERQVVDPGEAEIEARGGQERGGAGRPRRFARTFWRGFTRRARDATARAIAALRRLTGRTRRAPALVAAACALLLAACGAPPPSPALWRIADADSEIWLFGTIHVLPADLEWRSPAVDAAFRAADTVIFEADISESPEGARLRQALLERGLDRSGETLSLKIGAADWTRLERVAAKLGAAPAAFEPFMPWFAAMQLSALYVQSLGQSFDVGVERVLDEEARAQGKRLAYLETPEEHVGVLADLPLETQIAFLRATLDQLEAAQDDIEAIDRAWVRGDTQTLARLLNEDIKEAGPEAAHALLGARNARWRDRILALLAGEGRIFIAVGAAHLIGDESVIAMLRARGVSVEGP